MRAGKQPGRRNDFRLSGIAGEGSDIRQRARREETDGALQGDQRHHRRSSTRESADVLRHHLLHLGALVLRGTFARIFRGLDAFTRPTNIVRRLILISSVSSLTSALCRISLSSSCSSRRRIISRPIVPIVSGLYRRRTVHITIYDRQVIAQAFSRTPIETNPIALAEEPYSWPQLFLYSNTDTMIPASVSLHSLLVARAVLR